MGAWAFRCYHKMLMKDHSETTTASSHLAAQQSSADKAAARQREGIRMLFVQDEKQAMEAMKTISWSHVVLPANSAVLESIAHYGCQTKRQIASLVVPFLPRLELLSVLQRCFRRVVFFSEKYAWCSGKQLCDILQEANSSCAIGLLFDEPTQMLALVRADLSVIALHLSDISPNAAGQTTVSPPILTDEGNVLVLSDGPHKVREILEKFDATFRRISRRSQWASSTTPGQRIRHWRLTRRMRREDIPGLDVKTMGRIERGDIRTPQKETLRLIATALQIPLSALLADIPQRRHNRRRKSSPD